MQLIGNFGVNILWLEGNYPYLNQTFDLHRRLILRSSGEYVGIVGCTTEGAEVFTYEPFHFPGSKDDSHRMDVPQSGQSLLAFILTRMFLRAISASSREDGLHLFVDDVYHGSIQGNWGRSQVGLYTENTGYFNGMLHYQPRYFGKDHHDGTGRLSGGRVGTTGEYFAGKSTNKRLKWRVRSELFQLMIWGDYKTLSRSS